MNSRQERILFKRFTTWVREFLANNKVSVKEFKTKAHAKYKELEKEVQSE